MNFYQTNDKPAYLAQREAYWIAYAPFIFQAVRTMKKLGILEYLKEKGKAGADFEELKKELNLSEYAVRVLVHAGLGINVIYRNEAEQYFLTKTGIFLLNDKSVKVTMDFTHDVCYQGLFHLEDSIREGKPEGLKVLGGWNTIYEGLSQLPPHIQDSWFGLDHYYSDVSFPKAVPLILERNPKTIVDIGGNTGKFARLLIRASTDVQVFILDLPGQIEMARKNIQPFDTNNQVSFLGVDLLKEDQSIPGKNDVIWMSQFLDCFSESEIVSILKRCKNALSENGRIVIQEAFWDKQPQETSAFSLQQFSLYFTAMANGNSQMYDYKTFSKCIEDAGLTIFEEHHNISISNSLLFCA